MSKKIAVLPQEVAGVATDYTVNQAIEIAGLVSSSIAVIETVFRERSTATPQLVYEAYYAREHLSRLVDWMQTTDKNIKELGTKEYYARLLASLDEQCALFQTLLDHDKKGSEEASDKLMEVQKMHPIRRSVLTHTTQYHTVDNVPAIQNTLLRALLGLLPAAAFLILLASGGLDAIFNSVITGIISMLCRVTDTSTDIVASSELQAQINVAIDVAILAVKVCATCMIGSTTIMHSLRMVAITLPSVRPILAKISPSIVTEIENSRTVSILIPLEDISQWLQQRPPHFSRLEIPHWPTQGKIRSAEQMTELARLEVSRDMNLLRD